MAKLGAFWIGVTLVSAAACGSSPHTTQDAAAADAPVTLPDAAPVDGGTPTPVSWDGPPTWMTIPVSDVLETTAGPSCGGSPTAGAACVAALNQQDGTFDIGLACPSGNTFYTNPSYVQFDVPIHGIVADATLSLTVQGTAALTPVSLSCVTADAAHTELAKILPVTPPGLSNRGDNLAHVSDRFGTTPFTYVFDVPMACFGARQVTFAVTSASSDCLDADAIRLNVATDRHTAASSPVASVDAAGSCSADSSCLDELNLDNGTSVQLACGAGATGYANPTILDFSVPAPSSATGLELLTAATGSGSDAQIAITCVDANGSAVDTIRANLRYPATGTRYAMPVPLGCIHPDPADSTRGQVRVQLDANGTDCLGVDFMKLDVFDATQAREANNDDIEGYAHPLSARAGAPVTFMVHTLYDSYQVQLEKLLVKPKEPLTPKPTSGDVCDGTTFPSYDQGGLEAVLDEQPMDLSGVTLTPGAGMNISVSGSQATVTPTSVPAGCTIPGTCSPLHQSTPFQPFAVGAQWKPSFTLDVPSTWPSGMYAAVLTDASGARFYAAFVVEEAVAGTKDIAVIASTATWNAYNAWGGASAYAYAVDDGSERTQRTATQDLGSQLLAIERPNVATDDGLVGASCEFAGYGYEAEGELSLLGWLDAQPELRDRYAVITDYDVHDDPTLLSHYKAVIISTHSEYWSTAMRDNLDAYLEGGGHASYLSGNGLYWVTSFDGTPNIDGTTVMEVHKDRSYDTSTGEAGGLWRDTRPEAAVTGLEYDPGVWGYTGPFVVKAPTHWLFDDTDLPGGASIGATGVNKFGGAAAGVEMDSVGAASPADLTLLARADVTYYENDKTTTPAVGGDMVYYERSGGGSVFSAGSINFGGSLLVDPMLSIIVKNALRHALSTPAAVAVGAIPTQGSCSVSPAACLSKLAAPDGNALQWIACTNGLNTSTEYDNPTVMEFPVPSDGIDSGTVDFVGYSAGTTSTATVTCLDAAGNQLGAVANATLSGLPAQSHRWSLPSACATNAPGGGKEVRLSFLRTGANCIGADYVALEIVPRQVDPLVDIPTAGTCSATPATCMAALSQRDGVSLQYLACTNGLNTSTEYDNPTTLVFDASASAKSRTLTITSSAVGSTTADISCVDETGAQLAVLAQAVPFSTSVQTYQWGVPATCVTPTGGNPSVRIVVDRTGAFCLAPDLVQLTRW